VGPLQAKCCVQRQKKMSEGGNDCIWKVTDIDGTAYATALIERRYRMTHMLRRGAENADSGLNVDAWILGQFELRSISDSGVHKMPSDNSTTLG
jgi:hypothetical protein